MVIHNRNSLCAQCFCNGLRVNCRSSNLFYDQISSDFRFNNQDWTINNLERSLSTNLFTENGYLEFRDFESYPNNDLFFFAPASYLGNKLGSYGGNFSFSIRFEGSYTSNAKRLELRLSGNGISVVYKYPRLMDPYTDYKINVLITEDDFRKSDDRSRIDRETLLMVLSNLESLTISASFLEKQRSVLLGQVSLDHAERASNQWGKKALAVETCECPEGYTGKSCEVI